MEYFLEMHPLISVGFEGVPLLGCTVELLQVKLEEQPFTVRLAVVLTPGPHTRLQSTPLIFASLAEYNQLGRQLRFMMPTGLLGSKSSPRLSLRLHV